MLHILNKYLTSNPSYHVYNVNVYPLSKPHHYHKCIIKSILNHTTFCLRSSRPLIGAEIGAFTSRLNNPPGATASSAPQRQVSQTDDDIPEWKRAMLERQAARNRDAESYSTSSTASNQGKLENEFQPKQYNLMAILNLLTYYIANLSL